MALSFKDIDVTKLSQGMQQYFSFKVKHMDKILFFRLGDFYEMFFDDAIIASRVLELTLTGKDCGLEERAPMCGIPHHACDIYIKKLIENGYNVAICEQMEDPATAKGIVKRDIVRVVTPGTLIDSTMLDEGSNNWLCAVHLEKNGRTVSGYLCFADMSTGEAHIYSTDSRDAKSKDPEQDIIDLLARFTPSEIICEKSFYDLKRVGRFITEKLRCSVSVLPETEFDPQNRAQDVLTQFSAESLSDTGVPEANPGMCALCALCGYISDTQHTSVRRFSKVSVHSGNNDDSTYMRLGYTARTNLELVKTMRGDEKGGTLMWVLNKTKTAMGKRMLTSYIVQPLRNPIKICRRLDAVEELINSGAELNMLSDALDGVYDLQRLMTRVMYKKALPNDLRALLATALCLPEIKQRLSGFKCELLNELNGDISTLSDIAELISSAISDEQPNQKDLTGVIKPGYSEELDRLRGIRENGENIISDILEREREKTGIRNLKSGYNRVFGYYIEVTRSFYELVPDYYIRKQTLANCERFITEELKEAEDQILNASEHIDELEAKLFSEVRDYIGTRLEEVQKTSLAIGNLDVLVSFAQTAIANNYTKPQIAIDGIIEIKNGRHPVVELTLENEMFVPNDTYINQRDRNMLIITGPNMSGKSTYMRQVALITLMAQIGSFVPAEYAKISVVDEIFTRVGASDDLAAGQSTFMVEMSEVAEIVKNATQDSLVILDEVGRGTSTCDGISIARSVAEYIASRKHIGCKTLFATHYHELIAMEGEVPGVVNYSVAVMRSKDGVRFLRKIVRGGVDESYGIEVAKLAGLPKKIIDRANEILVSLECAETDIKKPLDESQLSFESIDETRALDRLRKTNVDELTDSELRELIKEIVRYI